MTSTGPRPHEDPAELGKPSAPPTHEVVVEVDQAALDAEKLLARNKLLSRVGYFSMYVGFSGVTPFYSVLLKDRGFSESVIGVVMAMQPLCTLLLLSPIAYIADRYHCATQIQLAASAGSVVLWFIITVFSSAPLLLVSAIMAIQFAFRCPIGPFYDQLSLSVLPTDRKTEWGSMRCFGGYGWGFFAPIASVLITKCGWWASGCTFALGTIGCAYCYTHMQPVEAPHSMEKRFSEVLAYVFTHRRILLFLLAECFMGLGYSLIGTFLFVFLRSIGAPNTLLGISITMTVVVEIPVFVYSATIQRYFTDAQLLAISMVAWTGRVIGYSFLYHPWLVLLLEPLHGMTFGLMWLAGVHFVNIAFPKSLSHSANGFLSASAFGVGPIIGNLLGGLMYNYWGPRWMFRVMAVIMLLLGIGFHLLDGHLARLGMTVLPDEDVVIETVASDAVDSTDGSSPKMPPTIRDEDEDLSSAQLQSKVEQVTTL